MQTVISQIGENFRICRWCGEPLVERLTFCGKECQDAYRKSRSVKAETRICPTCKKPFNPVRKEQVYDKPKCFYWAKRKRKLNHPYAKKKKTVKEVLASVKLRRIKPVEFDVEAWKKQATSRIKETLKESSPQGWKNKKESDWNPKDAWDFFQELMIESHGHPVVSPNHTGIVTLYSHAERVKVGSLTETFRRICEDFSLFKTRFGWSMELTPEILVYNWEEIQRYIRQLEGELFGDGIEFVELDMDEVRSRKATSRVYNTHWWRIPEEDWELPAVWRFISDHADAAGWECREISRGQKDKFVSLVDKFGRKAVITVLKVVPEIVQECIDKYGWTLPLSFTAVANFFGSVQYMASKRTEEPVYEDKKPQEDEEESWGFVPDDKEIYGS